MNQTEKEFKKIKLRDYLIMIVTIAALILTLIPIIIMTYLM